MQRVIKVFAFVCLMLYLSFLLYLLFFSHYRQEVKGIVDYNLIPFRSITRHLLSLDNIGMELLTDNFFGNILAFIPLGFLLPIVWNKVNTFTNTLIISSLCSLVIEITQWLTRLGAFDVDDIILNTIGGLCGFLLVRMLQKIVCKSFH
ncbi:VanZ family protein [Aquibacillus rhizosphaerae]|uniref:VanZ family protein n=1 Tax=Aquibacillus rhizosphaerae TaxID=3051431 RepID=A0ABT7L2I4_9BACI|nr:VanZ family protein [Aquibacillus sp. LR5S19]MDL4839614.1 VanZ family protein [Aquibacillus sp. LR5S19]